MKLYGLTRDKKGVIPFPDTVVVSPYSFITEGILNGNATSFVKMRDICKIVVSNFPSDFDWNTLLAVDMMVILSLSRALTYGENYTFDSSCPECSHSEHHTIKVPEELPVKTWKSHADAAALDLACTIKLPHCKDMVKVRPLTVADEIALMEGIKKIGDSGAMVIKGGASTEALSNLPDDIKDHVYRIARHIVSVNNTTPDDLADAINYVIRIEGVDKVNLEDFIVSSSCGIEYQWGVICDKCNHKYRTVVPIGSYFFRRN